MTHTNNKIGFEMRHVLKEAKRIDLPIHDMDDLLAPFGPHRRLSDAFEPPIAFALFELGEFGASPVRSKPP
jgi:hypothetical protein